MANFLNALQKCAIVRFAQIVALLLLLVPAARADDETPTTTSATQPPDKSQYTLFDPVPSNQMREMGTDRPDKTNSPITIDAGHLQIEMGVVDYVDNQDRFEGANGREQSLDFGQTEFRLGLLNNLELDAEVDAYDSDQVQDFVANQSSRQSGIGDTSVGETLNLWGNDSDGDWATAFGIQPELKIPTARQDLGNGKVEAFFGFPFQVNLPDQFGLGVETVVSDERNSTNTNYVTGWQNMASLDRVIFGKFDVYVEYWMHTSTERHLESQQTADIGFTYPAADNVILDTGVNFGLNKATETVECTAGISVRF
jgi:outer membrane putative beta-barrel porin/alpha-amylase